MKTPAFQFTSSQLASATISLLVQNKSLLKVIIQNQIESIAEKAGRPLEEIVQEMNARNEEFQANEFAEVFATWGK